MKYLGIAVCVLMALLVMGCGATTYLTPEFDQYRSAHKTVAILPLEVRIDPKKLPKDYTLEMTLAAEKEEGYDLQQELYTRLLKRSEKGEYTVEFQDISKTNALLTQAGLEYDQIPGAFKSKLCEILGVDAVIGGSIYRERPMSTGLAVGLGILFGAWGSTNKVDVNLTIHEATDSKLVWSYDHEASGSVGSSAEKLAESLMKNVSKKFPYKKPKTTT